MRPTLAVVLVLALVSAALGQASKYEKAEAEVLQKVRDSWVEAVKLAMAGGHEVLRMRAIDEARVAGVGDDALRDAEKALVADREYAPPKDGPEAAGILEAVRKQVGAAAQAILALDPPSSSLPRYVDHVCRVLEGDPKNAGALAVYQKRTAAALTGKDWPVLRALVMRAAELDPVGYKSGKYQAAERALVEIDGAIVVRAPEHQLQAVVFLPEGWTPKKTWPMFVSIVGPNFAHGSMLVELKTRAAKKPYILVVAMTITNGNDLVAGKLPYAKPIVDRYADIQLRPRRMEWDEVGLTSVLSEIRRRFSATEKFFMTGYGGGAFVLLFWLQHHADQLLGACSASSNYHPCVEQGAVPPVDGGCPVLIVTGSKDPSGPERIFLHSDQAAQRLKSIGFTQVDRRQLEGRGQEPYFELGLELLDKVVAKKK